MKQAVQNEASHHICKGMLIGLAWLTLLFGSSNSNAQIPDKFENLKVFPKDIGQRELIENMKSFCFGLGVRCQHCHVGEGDDLSTFDFASDEKEAKNIARIMIQMRNDINKKYLTQLAGFNRSSKLEVNCVTCHHGQAKPQTIEQLLTQVIEEEGIDGGLEKYRELREKHYGSYVYDFQEMPLNRVADKLANSGKLDAAIALLKLNVEYHPKSFMTHYGLGEMYSKKGNQEAALKSYQQAYEIMPNPRIKKKIEQLSEK